MHFANAAENHNNKRERERWVGGLVRACCRFLDAVNHGFPWQGGAKCLSEVRSTSHLYITNGLPPWDTITVGLWGSLRLMLALIPTPEVCQMISLYHGCMRQSEIANWFCSVWESNEQQHIPNIGPRFYPNFTLLGDVLGECTDVWSSSMDGSMSAPAAVQSAD